MVLLEEQQLLPVHGIEVRVLVGAERRSRRVPLLLLLQLLREARAGRRHKGGGGGGGERFKIQHRFSQVKSARIT